MITQRESIEQLAYDVKHLTAQIPRAGASKRKDPVDLLHASLLQMRSLVDRLLSETATMRSALARVTTEKLQNGVRDTDFNIMVRIADEICESSGFGLDDLRSPSRIAVLVHCRQAVMRALRTEGFTFSAIGRFLDRDHGTVMAAVKKEIKR